MGKSTIKNCVCEFCGKQFNTINGYNGHKYRSHLNKQKQKEFSEKGIKKRIENNIKCFHGKKHSNETKNIMSEKRVKNLNHNAFYSKRTYYKNVMLDSSYEVIVAKNLDENNIKWIRPKSLIWIDNEQKRRYIPDFYLPKYNVYLDPKNDFLIKKDKRKIKLTMENNNVKIIVLNKNQLTWDSILSIINNGSVV